MTTEPDDAPSPAQQAPAPERTKAESAIDAWVAAHIANSPISRSGEAFNYFATVALPALKQAFA